MEAKMENKMENEKHPKQVKKQDNRSCQYQCQPTKPRPTSVFTFAQTTIDQTGMGINVSQQHDGSTDF